MDKNGTHARDGTAAGFSMHIAPVKPALHPLTLSFSGDDQPLEEEFLIYYTQNALPQVRLSILVGIFVFAFFGLLDMALIPTGKQAVWIIRYGIVCPVALSVYLLTYTRCYERLMQISLSVMVLSGGAGIVAMIILAPPPASMYYDAGVILVFLYGYTFIRMRFLWATATCMTIVIAYEIGVMYIKPIDVLEIINNTFFFLGANLIGMFACYSIEYYTRRDFFMACKLGQEKEKVRAINLELEERVKQRTQQLVKANEDLKAEMETSRQAEQENLDLQLQLQQAQKMEAVGTLAGGIAHDFNNILGAIMGYTEISLLQTPEDNDVRKNLDKILKASQRAKELVNQILAFSRQRPLDVQVFRLKPLVKEVLALLRASLPRTIDIRQEISAELYAIEADPTQIHQVLMNLCTNAAHAMEENGGRLTVTLGNVMLEKERSPKLWDLSPGQFVRLSVEDTGHGIPPDIVERIFEPYFTTKKLGKGTGMGLAVTHGIIKSCGGTITVESQVGEGTRFDIYLPGYEKEEGETLQTIKTLPRGSEHILFIDDEENLVDVMKGLLQRLGYRVAATTEPLDALDLFRSAPDTFDLVITDAAMPRMTGDRLAKEFLAIRQDIPIIICTGYSERVNPHNIESLGIRRLLMKPLAIRNLAVAIREVMDQSEKDAKSDSVEPPPTTVNEEEK
ncbi:ATP-binding protein [Desulfosarcina variabilis]|uniref:ATP-binding protein n=1 Tax=Desulfosarcina variabilis TaxID=2300 RepID=UPI003AFB7815